MRVTRVEYFDGFGELFAAQGEHEDEKMFRHRQSLVRRARFGNCKTAQTLSDYLRSVYSEEKRKARWAMAISIKLAEKS